MRATSPEFVIRIILKARNELAGVLSKAAGDVDKLTAAQKRQGQSSKDLEARSKSLRSEFDNFSASVKRGEKSSDDAVFGLRRLGSEMDKLARKRPIGDKLGEDLNRGSVAAKRMIAEIQDVQRAQSGAVRQEIADRGKAMESRLKEQASTRNLASDVQRLRAEYDAFHISVQRGQVTGRAAANEYRRFGNEFGKLRNSFQAGSRDSLNLGAHMEDARMHADRLSGSMRRVRSASDEVNSSLARLFRIDPNRLQAVDKWFGDFERNLNKGRFSVAAFDNRLRGLIFVGAFAFFEQLVGVVGSLAGSLVSLASTAAQAGSALAGMAAAGVAQAIPVIGLFAAAWGRVGAVFQAVQQHQKNLAASAYNHAQAMDLQRQASERVRSAEDALAQSHARVAQAQQNLTKARFDATRQLQDLLQKEREAQIQAEQAALAQRDAQRALNQSIASGAVDQQQSNAIQVQSTSLAAVSAQVDLGRARQDLAIGRRRGVEGSLPVMSAKREIADARLSAAQAARSLQTARIEAAQTVKQMDSGSRMLQQMMGQFSGAEMQLYRTMDALYHHYLQVFVGDKQHSGILGGIIGAFTEGMGRVDALLTNPKFLSTARGLANAMGTQLSRIFKFFTSGANIKFFEDMANEAKRNLPLVVTLLENIFKIFRNFARAGSPALKAFLKFFDDLTGRSAKATGSKSGLAKLEQFFMRGEKYAEQIILLGKAFGGLFLAIIGDSAQQGSSIIQSVTDNIKDATKWINDHQGDVRKFFSDARMATGEVAHAIWEIGKALFSLFDASQVRNFVRSFTNALIPALVTVAKALGVITSMFTAFMSSGVGGAVTQLMLTSLLLFKALSPLGALVARLIVGFGRMAGSMRLAQLGGMALKLSTGELGFAIAAVVGLILTIISRLHGWRDWLKFVGVALGGVLAYLIGTRGLAGVLPSIIGQFDRLAAAGLAGKFGAIGTAFGGILTNVLALIRRLPFLNKLLATSAEEKAVTNLEGRTLDYTMVGGGRGEPRPSGRGGGGGFSLLPFGGGKGGGFLSRFGGRIGGGLTGFFLSQMLGQMIGGSTGKTLGGIGEGASIGFTLGGPVGAGVGAGVQVIRKELSALSASNAGTSDKDLAAPLKRVQNLLKSGDWENAKRAATGLRSLTSSMSSDAAAKIGAYADQVLTKLKPVLATLSRFKGAGLAVTGKDLLDPQAANEVLDNLDRLRTVGFRTMSSFRSELQDNIDTIGRAFREGSHAWSDAMVRNTRDGLNALVKAITDKQLPFKDGMAEMAKIAQDNMTNLRDNMANLSDEGRQALASNAIAAADAMEAQMKRAGKVTEAGMKKVRDIMTQALVQGYGFTQEQALNIAKTGDLAGRAPHAAGDPSRGQATGGWVGVQGERGGDFVNRWLGRGEAVLNWAHQRAVAPALAFAKRYGNFAYGSLDDVFKKVRGEHAGGGMAGMAAGGYAGLASQVPLSGVHAGVLKAARLIEEHFPGLTITSSTGGRHAVGSYHYLGEALDLSGAPDLMGRAANWIRSSGIARSLTEGIHNPNLSYKYGKQVAPSFWGPAVWAQHLNHIHIAIAGALRKMIAGGGRRLHNLRVDGPASFLTSAVQAGLNRVTSAANIRLQQGAAFAGGGGQHPSSGPSLGTGGNISANLAIGRRMAAAMGWIGAQWNALKQLWTGESGWNEKIANKFSGAYGIPQALPGSKMASAGRDWMTSAGTQIKWGLGYIAQRYGSPIKALQAWLARSPHWYETGGAVPGQGAQPIVAHGGEHVWTAAEVLKAGGHKAMYALRAMLGGGGQGGPLGYQQGGRVLQVGDSLGLGTSTYLKRYLPHLTSDDMIGRTSATAVAILKKKLTKAFSEVIFDVGTNDSSAKAFATSLRKAYKLVGKDRSLVVSTVEGPHATAKNRMLRQFAAAHSNVTIADWASYVSQNNVPLDAAQHIHPNASGYSARAKLMADAVKRGGAGGAAFGDFKLPTIFGWTMPGLVTESKKVQKYIDDLRTRSANFIRNLQSGIQAIAGQGGLLDLMDAAVQRLTTNLDNSLNLATYRLGKSGKLINEVDPAKVADRALGNLQREYTALVGERGAIQTTLGGINDRIAAIRKGGIKASEQKSYDYLIGYRRNLSDRLGQVQQSVAGALQSIYQSVEDAVQSRVDKATLTATNATARLDVIGRARQMLGGTAISNMLATVTGRRGGSSLIATNTELGQQRAGILGTQADQLQKAANLATKKGHSKAAQAILNQIADLRQQALEAVQAGIQADAEEITRQAGRRTAALDIRARIASALGRVEDVSSIATDRIQAVNDQVDALKKQQAAAASHGFGALAEQLGDQIKDLQASVTEIAAQQLSDAVDLVNNVAARRSAQLDVQGRVADLMQSAGNFTGAFNMRGSILQSRGQNILQQRDALTGLLTTAQSQGNEGEVNKLTDEIADLNTQLQENAAAIAANTVAARQAAIDFIQQRGQFQSGVFGNLNSLVGALGTLTGHPDIPQQRTLITSVIQTLQTEGGGLADQLFQGYGIDLRGADPQKLVDILSKLDYNGIEANFTVDQRAQFEALINSIIDNASAVTQNTQTLKDITTPLNQSWSTTAWQWFRTAIFNGSQGLLPQYHIPSMDTGGFITSDGLVHAHAGEAVVAANVIHGGPHMSEGDTNLYVTSPTEVLDPDYVAEVLHFKRGARRAS